MYVHLMHAWCPWKSDEDSGPLGLELWTDVNHIAGNQVGPLKEQPAL